MKHRRPTIDELRETVRLAVARQSVRKVAAAIKYSAAGLRFFLNGGDVYSQTSTRLLEWYAREGAAIREDEIGGAGVAFELMLRAFPVGVRPQIRDALIEALRSSCTRVEVEVPAWTEHPTAFEEAGSAE